MCRRVQSTALPNHSPAGTPDDVDVLLYDGVCALCNGLVRFLVEHDRDRRFRYAALQSEFARAALARYGEDPTDAFDRLPAAELRSDASSAACAARGRRSPRCAGSAVVGRFVARVLGVLPTFLLDAGYRAIARRSLPDVRPLRLLPIAAAGASRSLPRRRRAFHLLDSGLRFGGILMSDVYRIFGAELSPYSVKVRSYFRYKGIPHQWILRGPRTQEEFSKYAKLPLIPLVVTPQSEGIQDSTPIIEKIETLFPEPTIYPEDPALRFISALLEEYADEWGNKHMFHYRWFYEPDQRSAAERIARMNLPADAPTEMVDKAVANVRERMVPRLSFVGSSPETKEQIETSFRPLARDARGASRLAPVSPRRAPCARRLRRLRAALSMPDRPHARRDHPHGSAANDARGSIACSTRARTRPRRERSSSPGRRCGRPSSRCSGVRSAAVFLPWTLANAAALQSGAETVTVELEGRPFRQGPQKYHARSLAALRDKYKATTNRTELDQILRSTGCLDAIAA